MIKRVGVVAFEVGRTFSRPSHFRTILSDFWRSGNRLHPDRTHLDGAMSWLCRAQDATGCGGVSAGYFFKRGWMPPYPETTGYIIPTFLDYAAYSGDAQFSTRALEMGDWEIAIQLPTGAVRGGMGLRDYPIVFNSGQVMLGWMALYRATQMERFLHAAVRAADWLIDIQDDDGKWSTHTFMQVAHAYHTRVAWPLLEVYAATGNKKYHAAAQRNIIWTLDHSRSNGWIDHMGFEPQSRPLTHTIAYTLRGLSESAVYLEKGVDDACLAAVYKASENIIAKYKLATNSALTRAPILPATLDETWSSPDRYSCPTGNAQLAILWLKLSQSNPNGPFAAAALHLLDQVKAAQPLHSGNPGIRGGVAASHPIWGAYVPFAYLNWAAKFFADALMSKANSDTKIQ